MEPMRIPFGAYVLVCDGRKALLLQNAGDADLLNLKVQRMIEQENPSTTEQGSDKPGRSFSSVGSGRSAMEQTDWHDQAEHYFAGDIVDMLKGAEASEPITRLFVVAAPRMLADLRNIMPADLNDRIVAEIDKDLVNHPIPDIEKLLGGNSGGVTG